MIGLLFFGTLALVFLIVTKFSQWFFQFLNRKIGFADFLIWKKCTIYGLYFFSIFMVFFGDEWLGRIQHKYMCEKYAYLKYDREGLFNPNLEKGSLKSYSDEKKLKFTFTPMRVHKFYYIDSHTGKMVFEKTTVSKSYGWIERITGLHIIMNTGSRGSCMSIDFTGKENWYTPKDVSQQIESLGGSEFRANYGR